MILTTQKFNRVIGNHDNLQVWVWRKLKAFWQFSNFYGNYQTLPPAQRRLFVQSLNQETSL